MADDAEPTGPGLRGPALLDTLDRADTADPGVTDVNAVADAMDPRELGREDVRRLLATLLRLARQAPRSHWRKWTRCGWPPSSRAQLEAVVTDRGLHTEVLDEIFARLGAHIRVDRARSLHAVVLSREDGYEPTISQGACTVSRQMREEPRVTITVSPVDLFRLSTHQPVLFVTGKLKVKGDLAFAAGLIGYFGLPRPA